MDDNDLNKIEKVLNIILLGSYKKVMLAYPFKKNIIML